MKKAISMLLVMGLSAGLLAGCGAKSVSGSEEATAENPMVLTLSHGLSETHTVHIAMEEFAEKVEERTDGRIKVEIFPNARLRLRFWQLRQKGIIHSDFRIFLTIPRTSIM